MSDQLPGLQLRLLTEADVPAACELCRLAGWNQLPADWHRMRSYEPDGCFAAISDGHLVGTVTTTTYGTQLGWIGMMLVHPDYRQQGIGTALMEEALALLTEHQFRCIKLDASADGQPLYDRLGFYEAWSYHRWMRIGDGSVAVPTAAPEPIDCSMLDEEAFGTNRMVWLELLSNDSVVVSRTDGFGMLRPGHLASYLGPVTAIDAGVAREIIERLLQETSGAVFWDLPSPNQPAIELADSLGFEPVRRLTRMWTGQEFLPANYDLQFALSDPASG